MKKSSLVSIVFASLLMSPIVLARHVQAEEVATNSQEPALTSHVGQPKKVIGVNDQKAQDDTDKH